MDIKQADRIADSLEEMVFVGHFQEGERLDESSLAQMFGVSRTPIREALQRLVGADLAEQRPRRGVFVKQPVSRRLVEMFETMAEIEGVCGRLAVQRMTNAQLTRLEQINTECKTAVESNDADAYSRHNEFFHVMIYEMSGNAFLAGEAMRLYNRLKPFRRVQLQMQGRMAQSLNEHHALIEAFKNADEDRAADVLRSHIGTQGHSFPKHMAKLRNEAANRNAGTA